MAFQNFSRLRWGATGPKYTRINNEAISMLFLSFFCKTHATLFLSFNY